MGREARHVGLCVCRSDRVCVGAIPKTLFLKTGQERLENVYWRIVRNYGALILRKESYIKSDLTMPQLVLIKNLWTIYHFVFLLLARKRKRF